MHINHMSKHNRLLPHLSWNALSCYKAYSCRTFGNNCAQMEICMEFWGLVCWVAMFDVIVWDMTLRYSCSEDNFSFTLYSVCEKQFTFFCSYDANSFRSYFCSCQCPWQSLIVVLVLVLDYENQWCYLFISDVLFKWQLKTFPVGINWPWHVMTLCLFVH